MNLLSGLGRWSLSWRSDSGEADAAHQRSLLLARGMPSKAPYPSRRRELASMGSVADCYDNSMAESFFATLETELFWAQPGRRFSSHREAKLAISDYIEVFYNRQRRHTSIGSIPPVTYETRHAERADLAA